MYGHGEKRREGFGTGRGGQRGREAHGEETGGDRRYAHKKAFLAAEGKRIVAGYVEVQQ